MIQLRGRGGGGALNLPRLFPRSRPKYDSSPRAILGLNKNCLAKRGLNHFVFKPLNAIGEDDELVLNK